MTKLIRSMVAYNEEAVLKSARNYTVLAMALAVNWALASLVVWWTYDISSVVHGGLYGRNRALSLVAEMGLLIASLTSTVWLFVKRQKDSPLRFAWRVVWKTAAVLMLYALAVMVRRQLWKSDQGVSDSAMFLPVVGHINAAFFSEYGWLTFLLEVIPIIAFVSGLLYSLQTWATGQPDGRR
jgi:hypothetical protein